MSTTALARADKAVDELRPRIDAWRVYGVRWRIAHYVIGICALALTALIASDRLLQHLNGWLQDALPFLAAVCTGVLTFLSPLNRSNKYGRAWSNVANELLKYDVDDVTPPQQVMRAFQRGVELLNDEARQEPLAETKPDDARGSDAKG